MPTPPILTKEGIRYDKIPDRLLKELQAFQQQRGMEREVVEDFITNKEGNDPSTLHTLTTAWIVRLHKHFQPICEAWAKRKLVPTYVYGIRTYHRDTALKMHRDRNDTHIVSVIVNVNQCVDKPWPLRIEGASPEDSYREAFLLPGEVLLYEGNRLEHGRPSPLNGESFSNLFVHYRLA